LWQPRYAQRYAASGCLLELARDDELYSRLEYAEEAPWPALRVALETIRVDEDAEGGDARPSR
jgi:hypothetical protein